MSKPSSSKRVVFVCTGNTCRSPLAEGLMKSAAAEKGGIEVGSAGVAAMPGQGASSETLAILRAKGAGLKGFKSRQVDESVLSDADLIIAMTSGHADMIRRFFPKCADHLHLLCDLIDEEEGLAGADVPDPIGMGHEAYEEVAEVIELAVPGIIKKLEE